MDDTPIPGFRYLSTCTSWLGYPCRCFAILGWTGRGGSVRGRSMRRWCARGIGP